MKIPAFLKPNPITAKRLRRFRELKRGYYALLILLFAVFVSLFSEFIANNRAIVVHYQGEFHFPTFRFHPMSDFGMKDEYGFDDREVDYRKLKEEWKGTENWLLMPPIPFNPIENDFSYPVSPPHAPDGRHLLGTDTQGRDVAARLLYGFRISILFALALVLIGQVIGVIVGSLQGYLGGWFDILSQRVIEVWATLPFLYVVVLFSVFFTPSFKLLLLIMALFEWIGITYYMRTEVYREKSREYALAARALGASRVRIVFKHLLPNSLTPLVTLTPFLIVAAIQSLTALDYLGYGLPPPTPSWGELIDQALDSANRDKLWLSLSPFVAITTTLILVTLIGESVREAFDPKQYSRYE